MSITPYIWTITIALVLLYAVISGYIKGLLSQIGQIAGLIIGVLAARALTPSLLTMLRVDAGVETGSMITTVLCYMLVFFVGYFAIVMLARMIKLAVKVACLGIIDRICGAVFKLIKWVLILSLVYNLGVATGVCAAPGAGHNWLERTTYRVAPALLDMWQSKNL